MDKLSKEVSELRAQVDNAMRLMRISELLEELKRLKSRSSEPDFWRDNLNAQSTMKRISRLENRVTPWQDIGKALSDLEGMVMLDDQSLRQELEKYLEDIKSKLKNLKEELKFTGPFDDHDIILSLHSGAGGTDAQDWTGMLYRMYERYFESKGWTTEVISESPGEEAGLKSLTMRVEGDYVYGRMKGENGVHRLVRLSPFNADNLRQTSFAKVEILPEIAKPEEITLDDKDLKIDVYRSGGHGGQSVNTTDSAVRITHLPTGVSVAIQNERSQLQNKETALTILRSRLAQLRLEQHVNLIGELKGPNQSAEWGNQIRSYVLHPYKQVKDLRTGYETSDPDKILDGDLDPLVESYLEKNLLS